MMKMRNVWIVVLCFVLVSVSVSSILAKGDCGNVIIEGVIDVLVAPEIILDDGTIVDAANAVITLTTKGDKEVIGFEDLAEGMTVKVSGLMDDDVFMVAVKVNVMYDGEIK